MDYIKLLEWSFQVEQEHAECAHKSRLEYLSRHVFDFTTYESDIDEIFARKAVEVCKALTDRSTFQYIENNDGRIWYSLMCNMPFFSSRMEWGTSIRGAWWGTMPGKKFELQSCGFWSGSDQLVDALQFTPEQWVDFIRAVIAFASPEISDESSSGIKGLLPYETDFSHN